MGNGARRGFRVAARGRDLIIAVAALVAAGAAGAVPDPAAAPAAAPADSLPTLPGVTWAMPDDSADWRDVSGHADLDSLLLGGQGVVLAFEDTFAFDPAAADTVLVSAPRVTVAEVIAAIGRRMEYDTARMRSFAYTSLTTQIIREDDRPGGPYRVEEIAQRFHHDQDRGDQVVTLWERKRSYEGGEMVEDETDDEMEAEFLPVQDQVLDAMPFAPGSAHRFRYVIEDRLLVGNNLIYRISFVPKSRFEALPAGTIWVDYTNWVIRKIEARLTGAVPYPMFLKSVPVVRFSRERFGEFWFTSHAYMRVNLRKLPLVPIPDNVELRVRLQDIVINGEPQAPSDGVPGADPGADAGDVTAEDIAGGFWLTPEANGDSLAAFWSGLDARWEAEAAPDLGEVTLSPARVDSLTAAGEDRLAAIRDGSVWRGKLDPLRTPGFNRVQGLVPRVGFTLEELGPDRTRLDLSAGYALANERPVFGAELDLPLLRSRWTLADPTADGREFRGARYRALGLSLHARKDAALFAGDGRRHARTASAFLYGADPNHYYEERTAGGTLRWRVARGLSLRAGGAWSEHRPWTQQTDWNLLGRRLRPDGNRAAAALDDMAWSAGASWQGGPLHLDGDVVWHGVGAAGSGGGGRDLREWRAQGALDLLDGLGNRWLLRGAYRGFDGPAPPQWRTWLGDWGTLRGYEAGELTGDAGAHASLDVRLGVDLWRALRVPGLRNWGLQPIGFVDWGKTWDAAGGVAGPDEGARDRRMDVGFGFGKRFDVPGLGAFRNLRVYGARPVGPGSEGEGWRVLVGFER